MRRAEYARQDAKNILDNMHKNMVDLVTQEIEKAVTKGKMRVCVTLPQNTNEEAKGYLRGKLHENGYKTTFTYSRGEYSVEVEW